MKMRGGVLVENDRQRLLNKGFDDAEANRLINEFAGLYTIEVLEGLSANDITTMKQQLNNGIQDINENQAVQGQGQEREDDGLTDNESTVYTEFSDTGSDYTSDEEPSSDLDGGKRKRRRKTNKRKSKKRKSKKTRKNKKRRQRGGIIL